MRFLFSWLLLAGVLVSAGETYSFYLLSDTHWGAAETYDTKRFRGDIHRAEQAVPAYEKMFKHMVREGKDARFLIHLGDMVEGNAKGKKEQERQLKEAVDFLKKSFSFPVYYVRGNHDGHGPGGKEAVRAVLLPEMARGIGVEKLPSYNYSFTSGPDLFIVTDYAKSAKGEAFILKTLKAQKKKPRHVFIFVHVPVISSLTTPAWADTLARYNAVVFSGHIHRSFLLQYSKNGKKLTQVTVSSWLPGKNGDKIRSVLQPKGKEIFKNFIQSQAKKFKKQSFMSLYEKEWEPYLAISSFRGNGYMKVCVSDTEITLLLQGSDSASQPVKTTVYLNNRKEGQK